VGDGSSCREVVKKIQGSLGRVIESVVTTANGTTDSAALPERLRDRGGRGGREMHGLAIMASTITASKVVRPGRVK